MTLLLCTVHPRHTPGVLGVGDFVLVHTLQLLSWPRNCLQDPYFGQYRIIKIDGSRIHVKCSPRLGGDFLCAPKYLTHHHSPDDLSYDHWRISNKEVEKMDPQNASFPEQTDELEEMTARKMVVDG